MCVDSVLKFNFELFIESKKLVSKTHKQHPKFCLYGVDGVLDRNDLNQQEFLPLIELSHRLANSPFLLFCVEQKMMAKNC